ncbi:hypothetical protein CYY_007018 [Polysphondylium violaceum]|uniref:UbiA prenyltransferase family protein n=1 Tax=Polysphondylium violaceum TaxID=133409 RepID=A0A8J4PQ62_9MYCE|nr:hypothetical protein CYY_007018 [Polysphondylium violaceum]
MIEQDVNQRLKKQNNNSKLYTPTPPTTTCGNDSLKSRQTTSPTLKSYLMACRPWSLTISFTSVLLGNALAYKFTEHFDLVIFILTVFGGLSLQCIGNLVNSFYDYKIGADVKDQAADRTMFDFGLSESHITKMISLFLVNSLLCLVGVILRIDNLKVIFVEIVPLCLVGLLLTIFYTAAPFSLKYKGLGDLTILLTFGPLLVQGAFACQTNYRDFSVYIYSIPLALTIDSVLHVNNTRDIKADKQAGATTLASKIGEDNSYYLYIAIYVVAYLFLFNLSMDEGKLLLNFPVIVLPKVFHLVKEFKNKNYDALVEKTAIFSFFFGTLYSIGVMLTLE